MSKPPEPRPRSRACTLTTSSSPTSARPTSATSAIAGRRRSCLACRPVLQRLHLRAGASSTSSITRSCSGPIPGRTGVEDDGTAKLQHCGSDAIARRCARGPAARRRPASAHRIDGVVRPYPLDAHVHVALALGQVGQLVRTIDQLRRDSLSLRLVRDVEDRLHTQQTLRAGLHAAQRLRRSRDPRSRSVGERCRDVAARRPRLVRLLAAYRLAPGPRRRSRGTAEPGARGGT